MWLKPLPLGQQPVQQQHLLDDFTGRQVARHTLQAARAKHAAHRTADLRADADRPPSPVAQQHAFDPLPVGQLNEQLFGAIVRLLMKGDPRRPQSKVGRQGLRSGLGRSVMSSKVRARPANNQWRIWPARNFGSPRLASQGES